MPQIALTFDAEFPDQPTWSRNDPNTDIAKIVDALTQYSVPATFFIQGRWAQTHPNAVQRIAGDGFGVASHGFYHAPYRLLSPSGAATDVSLAHETLSKLTGQQPRLFRFPYGIVQHKSTVQAVGYKPVGWDFAPGDWNLQDYQTLHARMADASGIVLLHTWPASVSGHLKQYLSTALDLGVEFVKLEGA